MPFNVIRFFVHLPLGSRLLCPAVHCHFEMDFNFFSAKVGTVIPQALIVIKEHRRQRRREGRAQAAKEELNFSHVVLHARRCCFDDILGVDFISERDFFQKFS